MVHGEVEEGENRNCPDSSGQIWKEQKSYGIPGLFTSGALRSPVSVRGSVVRLGAGAQPLLCCGSRASRALSCLCYRAKTPRNLRARLPIQ